MYRGRLRRDLSHWVEKGLIDQAQAASIMKDYDEQPQSFSLGRVLSVLAALLVGAAILLLVASNWEEIPRLVRLGGLVLLLWGFYLSGAMLASRGQTALATASLLLGNLSFGGAMALVGQMYHISGDELTMMFVWFAAASLSAALFQSGALVGLAGFLSWAYFALYLDAHDSQWIGWTPWVPVVMAAIVIALVRYTDFGRARHLAYLLLIAWLTWLYSLHQDAATAAVFAAAGFATFLAVSVPGSPAMRLIGRAGTAPSFYTFLVAAIGLFLLHIEIETGPRLIVLGLATLGAAVTAIALCGRDNGAVRYLAYAVFAAEIFYIASETIGSIIGTSGFFLISGLLVAVVAFLVIRVEKRFHQTAPQEVQP